MRTKFFETPRADKHNRRRHEPIIRRQVQMLPKPLVINETLPITFNEIIRGVEFEDELKLFGNYL